MNAARVFITNDPEGGLNFNSATRYGPITKVTVGPLDIFDPDGVKEQVRMNLADFDYRKDYLLTAGAMLSSLMAMLVLKQKLVPSVQLLLFDSKKKQYILRTIDLTQ